MGGGTNASKLRMAIEKPMAADLSASSIHRTEISISDDLVADPTKLRVHKTARNKWKDVLQSIGQLPAVAFPNLKLEESCERESTYCAVSDAQEQLE